MIDSDKEVEYINDLNLKPKLGIEFDSEQSIYDFYNMDVLKNRFRIRKEIFYKNKQTDEITSRIFVCCKGGFRGKNERDSLIIKSKAESV